MDYLPVTVYCPANGIFNIILNIYFPSHVSGCLPVALLWLHYGQIETPRIVVAIESMDGYGKSIHLHLIEAHFDRVLDGKTGKVFEGHLTASVEYRSIAGIAN